MLNRRILFLCIMLAALAAASQAVPRVLGSAFAFAVLLGGLPIYIAARLNCTLGVLVYLAAAALSAFINMGEALFFLCTSGIIGLSLGILKKFFNNVFGISAFSAAMVTVMLSGIDCILGLSITQNTPPATYIIRVLTIFPLLCLYCLLYLKLSILTDNLLHMNIELNV